jgi:RNA polymerase sigma-70 factor (ECF subfamily)
MPSVHREEILARIRARVFNYLASKGGRDRERAEDVAQDTIMLLITKYASVEGETDLTKLSVTISRYLSMAAHRPDKLTELPEFLDPVDLSPGPDGVMSKKQLQQRVRQAILRLGPRCRELYELMLQEYSTEEIRERMKAGKAGNVYVWKNRCNEQMQKILGGMK